MDGHKVLNRYLNSYFYPCGIFFLCVVFYIVAIALRASLLVDVRFPVIISFWLVFLSFFGILAAAIVALFRKKWKLAITNILGFLLIGAFPFIIALLLIISQPQSVSKNWVLPRNIELFAPEQFYQDILRMPERKNPQDIPDAFRKTLLEAVSSPGDLGVAEVDSDLFALVNLYQNHYNRLLDYLAMSPAWRVYKDDDRVLAARRWNVDAYWRLRMNGYYSFRQLNTRNRYTTRLILNLQGSPGIHVPLFEKLTRLENTGVGEVETVAITNENANRLMKINPKPGEPKYRIDGPAEVTDYKSRVSMRFDELEVEVFEESPFIERKLTNAGLGFLKEEFEMLSLDKDLQKARSQSARINQNEDNFILRKSYFFTGYDMEYWGNPGEPGWIYLKAFEVTTNTSLSSKNMQKNTMERIGWSDNPEELFLMNGYFWVREGEYGEPFAARFEVWFQPDSGEPERKLHEKVYRLKDKLVTETRSYRIEEPEVQGGNNNKTKGVSLRLPYFDGQLN